MPSASTLTTTTPMHKTLSHRPCLAVVLEELDLEVRLLSTEKRGPWGHLPMHPQVMWAAAKRMVLTMAGDPSAPGMRGHTDGHHLMARACSSSSPPGHGRQLAPAGDRIGIPTGHGPNAHDRSPSRTLLQKRVCFAICVIG